jgi:hypothetical protein
MFIRRRRRCFFSSLATTLAIAAVLCSACGSGPRATTADLGAIRQPTPDPTLDAVVRDLPRVLAGVAAPSPTPTPMPIPTPRSTAVPKPKPVVPPTPAVVLKPTPRPVVPTATARSRP